MKKDLRSIMKNSGDSPMPEPNRENIDSINRAINTKRKIVQKTQNFYIFEKSYPSIRCFQSKERCGRKVTFLNIIVMNGYLFSQKYPV